MKSLRILRGIVYVALGIAATWYGAESLLNNHLFSGKYSPDRSAFVASAIFLVMGLGSLFLGVGKLSGDDPSEDG
jgi:hypothetical protein